MSDGTLWATGYNGNGQLGLGDTTHRLSWVQSLSGVAAVAGGGYHSFALKPDGTLWATGHNYYGQLGLGDRPHRSSWALALSGVAAVASGGYHSFALKSDGGLPLLLRGSDRLPVVGMFMISLPTAAGQYGVLMRGMNRMPATGVVMPPTGVQYGALARGADRKAVAFGNGSGTP